MKKFFSALLLLLSLSLAIFFVSCGDETKPDTEGGGNQTTTCEHQWNRGKTEKEATCTEPGTVLKTCLICEETKIEETANETTATEQTAEETANETETSTDAEENN